VVASAGDLVIDHVGEFGVLDGRFSGNLADTSEAPQLNFPWFAANQSTGPCANGICAVTDATISQEETTATLQGVGVFKPGFFAYQLAPSGPNTNGSLTSVGPSVDQPGAAQLLAFGGTKYTFAASDGETSKLYKFDLGTVSLALPASFSQERVSPGLAAGPAGTGYVSPLQVLDNSNEGDAGGVWLQTGFFKGNGQTDTLISVSLGDWSEEDGLRGFTRGGLINLGTSFSGNAASLAGPDGEGMLSHFMGTGTPNVVVGSGDNAHIGIGTGISSATTQGGSFKGFAAGLNETGIVGNLEPNDVVVSVDGATNTMTASLNVGDGAAQNPKYKFEFGGPMRSAAIDTNTFAAVEAESGSKVSEEYLGLIPRFPFIGVKTHTDLSPEVMGFIVSADAIKANEILFGFDPQTKQPNKRAFCDECSFMKWGAWGAQVAYTDHKGQEVTKSVPLGWWIAGDVVPSNLIPKTGTATYTGDAVGNVRNGTSQYVAKGNMTMGWDFARRAGLLSIQNFDNKSFAAIMAANKTTPEKFNGIMAGSNGATGAANGAFVGTPVGGGKPLGVLGNFGVGKPGYQATGIYGGIR
jgi:hypothetical protein